METMTEKLTAAFLCICKLNLKLYEFKYGKTTEGKKRLEAFRNIEDTVKFLYHNGINLSSIYFNLALVFPVMPMKQLSSLEENLNRLRKKQPIDLTAYTETLFHIATELVQSNRKADVFIKVFSMQTNKRSRLDDLESKDQILACFKKIKLLENGNSARGRQSAFATVYQQEIRPLLKDTVYFKPRVEFVENDEEITEKKHTTNDRAYKSIKKLYDTWKRNQDNKLQRLIQYFEDNLWHVPSNLFQEADQMISPKELETMQKFLAEIDDLLLTEK